MRYSNSRRLAALWKKGLAMALLAQAAGMEAMAQAPLVKLDPVPFTGVRITDAFWAPRRATNRDVTLRHALAQLETTGTVRNLELAAAGAREGFEGYVFQDSDVYKTIEAVSYSLATDSDPELDRALDALIAKVAAAQMEDGYLDSAYQIRRPDRRWTNLRDDHELYCAGHLFEAAVAHYQATGKKSLLDVATKFADHIAARFGPGKTMGYPGHPEVELALVKLWKATGQTKYFDLARFFVENRGTGFFAREHNTPADLYDGTYWQDNVPIREHRNIVGHAVRAAYLFSGVADVARETGEEGLLKVSNRVWRNTTTKRMYVTGGIGASGANEGFTTDYDLPNLTAYQETCASVAMAMWNHRLNLLYGESRYADVMETALYNGALAGVSLDGTRFFYVNPLSSRGHHHRAEWFGCACCPPNIARTLSSLGGYAYATSGDALWVNLYIQGGVKAKVGRRTVDLDVATDYPWDGTVKLTVKPDQAARFGLRLRVPGWAEGASVRVNGTSVSPAVERGYYVIDRQWKAGDVVDLDLPMPVRRIASNPWVKPNAGRLALARGPLVYCLEGADHEIDIEKVAIPASAGLIPEKRADLLGGVVVLKGQGIARPDVDWNGKLYHCLLYTSRCV